MLLEDYSARSKKTLEDSAFKIAAPKIYNILPEDITMQENYNIFKDSLRLVILGFHIIFNSIKVYMNLTPFLINCIETSTFPFRYICNAHLTM